MILSAAQGAANLQLDPSTITTLLVGVVIPFVVDLVTRDVANPKTKAAIASGLAALSGALSTVAWDPGAGWKAYVYNIAFTFFSTFVTHQTGVTDVVQNATKHVGIKGPRPKRRDTTPTRPVDSRPGTAHAGRAPAARKTAAKKTGAKKAAPRKRT